MHSFLLQDLRFIAISVFIGISIVCLIFWFLDRSPFSHWFKSSEGIANSFISVPAFLFGLVISTLATGVLNNHVAANTSLINETAAVRALFRISDTLTPPDKQKLISSVTNYVNSIVDVEWPAMAAEDRENYGSAIAKLQALNLVSNTLANNPSYRPSSINRLESAIDALYRERLIRLSLAYDRPSLIRWPSIYALSFLLLFTVGLIQLRKPKAMKITLAMGALCIGTSMIFVFLNISPYRGVSSIKPVSLIESLH